MTIHYWFKRDRKGKFDSFKSRVKRFVHLCVVITWTMVILATAFAAGAFFWSSTETVLHTVTVYQDFPVLDHIGDCESGNGKSGTAEQFNAHGQIVTHANKDGSVDIGKYGINNKAWGKIAGELGYNLSTLEGNTAMARWIFVNVGTGPWYSSKKCWYRFPHVTVAVNPK